MPTVIAFVVEKYLMYVYLPINSLPRQVPGSLTSNLPFASNRIEALRKLIKLHVMAVSIPDDERLNQTIDICCLLGKPLYGASFGS